MQHDCPGIGLGDQLLVQAPARKGPFALGLLLLLAHGGPHIGVKGMGAAHGRHRLVQHRHAAAAGGRQRLGTPEHLPIGLEAHRATDAHVHAQQGAAEQQRVGHVVAVAHVAEGQALELAEGLLQGEVIGEGLAGVLQVGEGVDHRDRGPVGVFGQFLLGEGADSQGVHVAAQHPGRVGHRFAPTHLGQLGVEVEGLAA